MEDTVDDMQELHKDHKDAVDANIKTQKEINELKKAIDDVRGENEVRF